MQKIINVTPHSCTFQSTNGDVYEVQPCGIIINAKVIETPVWVHPSGAKIVKTEFVPDPTSEIELTKIEKATGYSTIIVGSIIAAQAFPGRVLAMIPAPGFERVSPEQKRMRDDKFTTF